MQCELGNYNNAAEEGVCEIAVKLPINLGGFIVFRSGKPTLTQQEPLRGFSRLGSIEIPNWQLFAVEKLFQLQREVENGLQPVADEAYDLASAIAGS